MTIAIVIGIAMTASTTMVIAVTNNLGSMVTGLNQLLNPLVERCCRSPHSWEM